jgi:hypothetical protein
MAERKNRYGGQIEFNIPGYEGQSFGYGTGGSGRGSSPSGTWPVSTYYAKTPKGLTGWAVNTPGGRLSDPKYPGADRTSMMIHADQLSDVDDIITAGCIGISKSDWPAFSASLKKSIAEHGEVFLTIDAATGSASIDLAKPVGTPVVEKKEFISKTGDPASASPTTKSLTPNLDSSLKTIASFSDRRPAAAYQAPKGATASAPAKTIASSANVPKGPFKGAAQRLVQAAIDGRVGSFSRAATVYMPQSNQDGFPYQALSLDKNKEALGEWFNNEVPPAEQAAFKAAMEKPEFRNAIPEAIGDHLVREPFLEIVGEIKTPSAEAPTATVASKPAYIPGKPVKGSDAIYNQRIAAATAPTPPTRNFRQTVPTPWHKRADTKTLINRARIASEFDQQDRDFGATASPQSSHPMDIDDRDYAPVPAKPYNMADFGTGYRAPTATKQSPMTDAYKQAMLEVGPKTYANQFDQPDADMGPYNAYNPSGVNPQGQWSPGSSFAQAARPTMARQGSTTTVARPTIATQNFTKQRDALTKAGYGNNIRTVSATPRDTLSGGSRYAYSTGSDKSGNNRVTSYTAGDKTHTFRQTKVGDGRAIRRRSVGL